MVEDIDQAAIAKMDLLKQHPVFTYIKTDDDLKSALLADAGVWHKCNVSFSFFASRGVLKETVENYGASKIIDVVSKYNFDDKQLREFTFKLAKEKGKFAGNSDDLDRLAKIIVAPDWSWVDKWKLMDVRDSYGSLELLEEVLAKPVEGEGWLTWLSKKIWGEPKVEPVPEVNEEPIEETIEKPALEASNPPVVEPVSETDAKPIEQEQKVAEKLLEVPITELLETPMQEEEKELASEVGETLLPEEEKELIIEPEQQVNEKTPIEPEREVGEKLSEAALEVKEEVVEVALQEENKDVEPEQQERVELIEELIEVNQEVGIEAFTEPVLEVDEMIVEVALQEENKEPEQQVIEEPIESVLSASEVDEIPLQEERKELATEESTLQVNEVLVDEPTLDVLVE